MASTAKQTAEFSQCRETRSTDSVQYVEPKCASAFGAQEKTDSITFRSLIVSNKRFGFFLLSFILARLGGWLTYVASITLIEDIMHHQDRPRKSAISTLVALRFLPIVVLSPIGGALADSYDRRKSMIKLDIVGAFCPLLSLVALRTRSIPLIYVVTALQQGLSGLYEPCRSSFTPLLVSGEEELKKAITLTGLSWSVFAALGSSLGGAIVTSMGLQVCFMVDSLTYMASAALLWVVGEGWETTTSKAYASESLCEHVNHMMADGVTYLRRSPWGILVFLKATACFLCGASDVLNITVAESVAGESALRLGWIFACTGIGSLVGSLVVNATTNLARPAAVQQASIVGLGLVVLGFLGACLSHPFLLVCIFTVLRSAGNSLNWINSTLLLQKFSSPALLGRVVAVDSALALLTEASSAWICGILQDRHLSSSDISVAVGTIGASSVCVWSLYLARNGPATVAVEDCEETCSERTALVTDIESML